MKFHHLRTFRLWKWVPALLLILAGAAWAQDSTAVGQSAEQLTSDLSWTSVLPPLLAIALALIFRQVLFAMFLSIWFGAFLASDGTFSDIIPSFFGALSDFIVPAIADTDHASIMVFSLLIGGMIGIIQANGGTNGIIDIMSKYVKTRRQGQIMTSLLGFVIFFDDYSNTLIVGNTMRPLTDKLRITRAKLAYLVDSTAAPVATVAVVSTWIGAMVAYIADAAAFMPTYNEPAYLVFVNSLPYNFYAFFTIFFVLMISYSSKDFGPMKETRIQLLKAASDPKLDKYDVYKKKVAADEVDAVKSHWSNAGIPILVLVLGTTISLWITGEGETVQDIIGSSNSYAALLWGSLVSVASAIGITRAKNLINTEEMIKGMNKGMHLMFDGLTILVLAWGLSAITKELHTADFLVSVFNETLNPFWIPIIIFILSALTSFATGSSWGTMGILMPLVVPLVWNICNLNGIPYEVAHELIYGSVASVLAGSVLGDHCSPISDTTILSSIASQCDHIEHVRTQLPYALTVGAVSILALISQFVLDVPNWILYVVGIGILAFIIMKFGENVDIDPELDEHVQAAKIAPTA